MQTARATSPHHVIGMLAATDPATISLVCRHPLQSYNWFNALPDLDEIDKTRPKSSNFSLV